VPSQSKPGELDDLYSMTINKQHLLEEASKTFTGKPGGAEDFPALPAGTPLLGGTLKPGELMTPQMLISKPSVAIDPFGRADQHHFGAAQVTMM
jgi:hypothetical protein